MITKDQTRVLAELIVRNIGEEFSEKFLTGNLVNSIKIEEDSEGISIRITAPKYSFKEWFLNKVIKPTYKGSYAQQLDSQGSHIISYDKNGKRKYKYLGNHKGYIENCIKSAIDEWKRIYKINGTESEF